MKKNTKSTKIKTKVKPKAASPLTGDVPQSAAINALKEEIIEKVRRLSDGSQMSLYPLVEQGKQLLELERLHREATPSVMKSPISNEDGPIRAEISDDDF